MTEESKHAVAAVPHVVQSAALAPSRAGVLPALPDDIADANVPALLTDIERRVEALPGAFDAALARRQVVAVNVVAVAMQARHLRRVTDRALALIEARLAALIPANPPGRPPRPAGKPDGQLAGFDAGQPDRAPSAARPAETYEAVWVSGGQVSADSDSSRTVHCFRRTVQCFRAFGRSWPWSVWRFSCR